VNTFSGLVLTARHVKRVGNTRRPAPCARAQGNTKYEIINPKQIQNIKLQIQNGFENSILEINDCLEFRY
jgi:hypothetical protein